MSAFTANNKRIKNLSNVILNSKPEICFQRAILLTESYQGTEQEPTVIKRAKALSNILNKMTIYILDDELIVGNLASKPLFAPFFPEYGWEKSLGTLINEHLDAYRIRGTSLIDELEENLSDVLRYWEGKTVYDKAEGRYSEAARKAQQGYVLNYHGAMNGLGHITVDYAKVLHKGLRGIRQEAQTELDRLNDSNDQYISKHQFLEAVIISLEAGIRFSKRLAKQALDLAQTEKNMERRKELLQISENCNRVPEHPAQNFWEALQSFWIIQLIMQIETNGHSVSPGRFDQYMYPYFADDIKKGILTRNQAQELLDCLWVKFNDTNKLKAHSLLSPSVIDSKGAFFPYQLFQNISLGGQTADGKDAVNELSYFCLNATARVGLTQPSISVRTHKDTPEKFILKACEVIRQGTGMPQLFNDETVISAKVNRGVALAHARDYSILGCVELGIPGKELNSITGNIVNLAKCLELAINNGVDHTGSQAGPPTGNAAEFKEYEAIWGAFKKQVSHAAEMLVESSNAALEAHRQVAPRPFMSALVDDCISCGKSIIDGGAQYCFNSARGIGLPNVADSLAAIKKIVFEDKSMTMAELKQLLETDFKENEYLRQLLLNRAPKYGNDQDDVDAIAGQIGDFFCRIFDDHQCTINGQWQAGLWSSADNVACGVVVGATPDGRKSGDILADNISPSQGRDLKGPTAAARSAAKIDHVAASDGTSFHIKLNPSTLEGDTGLNRLNAFVKGFFNMGGMNCQVNVLNSETLLDAQKNPHEYRDLVVRVAGFSAFFIHLDTKTQDDIIRRTIHGSLG